MNPSGPGQTTDAGETPNAKRIASSSLMREHPHVLTLVGKGGYDLWPRVSRRSDASTSEQGQQTVSGRTPNADDKSSNEEVQTYGQYLRRSRILASSLTKV